MSPRPPESTEQTTQETGSSKQHGEGVKSTEAKEHNDAPVQRTDVHPGTKDGSEDEPPTEASEEAIGGLGVAAPQLHHLAAEESVHVSSKFSEAGLGITIVSPDPTSTGKHQRSPNYPQELSSIDLPTFSPVPPPKDEKFRPSPQLSMEQSPAAADSTVLATQDHEAPKSSYHDALDDSQSEIQSIMEQFEDGMGGPGEDEIMSPRLEKAGPFIGSPSGHPPRKSSLEVLNNVEPQDITHDSNSGGIVHSPPPRTSSLASFGSAISLHRSGGASEASGSPLAQQKSRSLPPPPQPDPESDLPFDFHRFLEQLRHRTADPVAKFLRSFLLEFAKRQWMVHEQVKIISDFLEFISKKMAQCEVWRNVSDSEFDNAREGMEKLVMNRLYSQTFSPAIPAPEPIAAALKDKRRPNQAARTGRGPGRRGQHQEDVERDEVLAQKVRIYGWVREEHLDIKSLGEKGRKFMALAQQELLKIKSYRAPRDKVICILNCCKVIFGFLRNSQHDQSADSFIPLLIYTVLKANPDHLVSNVQYILRFRNQDKLGGEAGYYISSLMGAVQFVENIDRTSLTITDEDFEKNVEAAVSAIAEGHKELEPPPQLPARRGSSQLTSAEKTTTERLEPGQSDTLLSEHTTPRRSPQQRGGGRSEEEGENGAAVSGLLRTIQRPLSSIGRMFSDDVPTASEKSSDPSLPPGTPQPPSNSRPILSARSSEVGSSASAAARVEHQSRVQQNSAEDAAARQASAEAEEARKIREREEGHVVETLCGMFPTLDKEVIQDVVRANEGRVGKAVDACLAMST